MIKRFQREKSGAVLVYVAVGFTALLAVAGLSFDFGRHYILSQELQKAADAAATAGAFQINPGETNALVKERVLSAVTNSTTATSGTPVTTNSNKIGADANERGVIDIANVVLLNSIPADDDTALPTTESFPANYVSVTTEARINNNIFLRLAGADPTISLTATSVATRGQAICSITPLFICNPAEQTGGAGAPFVLSDWLGKQVIAREHPSGQGGGNGGGNDAAWFPGNFGFLEAASFGNGAKELAEALASGNTPACFRNEINSTSTGAKNAVRAALNTRFDLYENPFFNNEDSSATYGPAENVRKGYTDGNCNNQVDSADGINYQGLPRDNTFAEGNGGRFGDGRWDCATYWNVNHPGQPLPVIDGNTCADNMLGSDITRFQIYRYEIDQNRLGDVSPGGENGFPICNPSNAIPPIGGDLGRDRRIVTMAIVDCVGAAAQSKLTGKTDIPVKAYINGFLTEPVATSNSDPDRGDMIFEIVGSDTPGSGNVAEVVARDWVEIVR